MKAATLFPLTIALFIIPLFSLAGPGGPPWAQAREMDTLELADNYSQEELAQMLAPVALYPDALLAQVLMASTYPLEIIEADRWLRKHPNLQGEALDRALLDKNWDPSVKAICHVPAVLALMSERISETTHLGNAFLAQETQVMDTVQELRARAYAQGNLTTSAKQQVIVEQETILIETADPRVIYVPYYNPLYIYGPWWYPAYPPSYWGPPGGTIRVGISYWPTLSFGFIFGTWSSFDWHRHTIYLHAQRRPRFVRPDQWLARPGPWVHDPRHRRGVAFRNKSTARKYGHSVPPSRVYRRDTRGFPELRDRDRPTRQRPGQQRQPLDFKRQARERAERDRQKQHEFSRQRQMGQDTAPYSKERQRLENSRQEQTRLEHSQARQGTRAPALRRENIFNRSDNGRMERNSSERGRSSRQGRGTKSDRESRGNKRW